ncbi:MAG: FAD-dependent oxidoreductase [Bacteroidota bacterium]
MPNRRKFIKNASFLALGATGVVNGCVSEEKVANIVEEKYRFFIKKRTFPKLKVSMDRVIKETVGLRPYRTLGPRIEKVSLGQKQLIHNYGHGGSGWSLSWGCAKRAVDLTDPLHAGEYAVLGCGVSGLSTAILLQEQGKQVNIYTQALPPAVTSSIATGTWSPDHYLAEDAHIDEAFITQWREDCTFSFRRFQDMLGLVDQVEWTDSYVLMHPQASPRQASSSHLSIPGLLPETTEMDSQSHPFPGWKVSHTSRMVFNIPLYLENMLSRFLAFGGKIHIKTFEKLEHIDELQETIVFNCTGLGSKALFEDEALLPVSGQLSFLLPQPELTYGIMGPDSYAIPRRDAIILGGNHIRGSWDTKPRKEETERVVSALREITENMVY